MSTVLKQKDFATQQEVRWCPGCGDYAILKQMTRSLADVGADPEGGEVVPTDGQRHG